MYLEYEQRQKLMRYDVARIQVQEEHKPVSTDPAVTGKRGVQKLILKHKMIVLTDPTQDVSLTLQASTLISSPQHTRIGRTAEDAVELNSPRCTLSG